MNKGNTPMGLVYQRHELAALCVHAKAHRKQIKSWLPCGELGSQVKGHPLRQQRMARWHEGM